MTLQLDGMGPEEITLTLFDCLGRVVLTQKVEAGATEFSLGLPADKFIPGEYYVRVASAQTVITKKLSHTRSGLNQVAVDAPKL